MLEFIKVLEPTSMSTYRKGAVLGLTVAETFILFTFILLIALLGLVQQDESSLNPDTANAPRIWVRPEKIEALTSAAGQAHKGREKAEQALSIAEQERDQARNQAEQALTTQKEAEQALSIAEQERDQARNQAEQALTTQKEAEQALAEVQDKLSLLRRKGENPPCWYQVVNAGGGKTREKPYYVANVAIHEHSIELARSTVPPGAAYDDGGGLYADEWKQLRIDDLPYGMHLSDDEFKKAVHNLYEQGRSQKVRTYECIFSVRVWDKTPDHAKKRWKYAHDRVIEGLFGAYTVQDLEWKEVN